MLDQPHQAHHDQVSPLCSHQIPHATHSISVKLGLGDVPPVHACQTSLFHQLPHAQPPKSADKLQAFRADHQAHPVHQLPLLQLFQFLVIVPSPLNVHLTNILYHAGSIEFHEVHVKLL